MLNRIPKILSPELVKIMMEMGHGDELVIADGNFPAEALGQRCVRADGHGAPELLEAILELMPLDTYADPVFLMERVPGDETPVPIWDTYKRIVSQHTDREIGMIERFAFYERAKKAYCVVATGESAVYANVIIKKGVVK